MLITSGALLYALAVKGVAVHHEFIAGGLFGAALFVYYGTGWLSPAIIFAIFNVPLFVVGWLYVSKRFFWYSLYAVVVASLAVQFINLDFSIDHQVYAAVAFGAMYGAGSGIMLRSLGSGGGLDILGVILFSKFNIGIGRFYFLYNGLLFAFATVFMDVDLVIASLIAVFIGSATLEYVLALFSNRKMVFVVSEKAKDISKDLMERHRIGSTFLKSRGAYSGREGEILMTVINNVQLKSLEHLVFSLDEKALFIVENTFSVLGSSFSKRKIY